MTKPRILCVAEEHRGFTSTVRAGVFACVVVLVGNLCGCGSHAVHQDFRRGAEVNAAFGLWGEGASRAVRFAPDGLRIAPSPDDPVSHPSGLVLNMVLEGDFDVRLRCGLSAAESVSSGRGPVIQLRGRIEGARPQEFVLGLAWRHGGARLAAAVLALPSREETFRSARDADGRRAGGWLRVQRIGNRLRFGEASDSERPRFRSLGEVACLPGPVGPLRIVVDPGAAENALVAEVQELAVTAGDIRGLSPRYETAGFWVVVWAGIAAAAMTAGCLRAARLRRIDEAFGAG